MAFRSERLGGDLRIGTGALAFLGLDDPDPSDPGLTRAGSRAVWEGGAVPCLADLDREVVSIGSVWLDGVDANCALSAIASPAHLTLGMIGGAGQSIATSRWPRPVPLVICGVEGIANV